MTTKPTPLEGEDEPRKLMSELESLNFYEVLMELHEGKHSGHNCFCTTEVASHYRKLLGIVRSFVSTKEREAYESGYADGRAAPMVANKRMLHMLAAIDRGDFTTCYAYAKAAGISHQAAQQTYSRLVSKGLVLNAKEKDV